jgi:hypothetical protein
MTKQKSQEKKPIIMQGLFGPFDATNLVLGWRRKRARARPSLQATPTEPMLLAAARAYRLSVRKKLASEAAVKRIWQAFREATLMPEALTSAAGHQNPQISDASLKPNAVTKGKRVRDKPTRTR